MKSRCNELPADACIPFYFMEVITTKPDFLRNHKEYLTKELNNAVSIAFIDFYLFEKIWKHRANILNEAKDIYVNILKHL